MQQVVFTHANTHVEGGGRGAYYSLEFFLYEITHAYAAQAINHACHVSFFT